MSKFWRSLEISLTNCKVALSLTWIENCVLSGGENIDNAGAVANTGTVATFKITNAKIYVPIVTLSTKGSAKLAKWLSEWFKRSVYWNKYKVIPNKNGVAANNNQKYINKLLDSSYRGVKQPFILAKN